VAVGQVRAVPTGGVQPCARLRVFSAIDKRPCAGPVWAGPEGLTGDGQGDRRVHGGPDKAVHVYPWPHLAAWARDLPPDRHGALEAGALART
jgi:MOSC domain-containing protein YiiM